MADGSVGMSDNAAAAQATTALLAEHVRELIEETFTDAELDAMSKEEREQLVLMLRVGCFPHLRSLLGEWAIKKEDAFMKAKIPVQDQHLRMDADLNSLLFAIQKNFHRGFDQYAKGVQNSFFAYLEMNFPEYPLFNTGRAGTGTRMDANFEVAHAVALNFTPYCEYLMHSESISADESILNNSIRDRLLSLEFYTRLITRARFWVTFFAPLRVLCNSHGAKDHDLHDMGLAMDDVEEAMVELRCNPALMRDPSYRVFTCLKWPCLIDYYASRITKTKGGHTLVELDKQRLYNRDDEVEDMVDELTVCLAEGVLDGLYHNAFNFLTSCYGKYSYDEWDEDMIEKTKHCVADNIILAESILGSVDYYWRQGVNGKMSTASGLVMARQGKCLDGAPAFFEVEHKAASIAFVKINHDPFAAEENEQIRQQELSHAAKLKAKELQAQAKLLRESLNQVSYFTISTLRTIKTATQLDQALSSLKSNTQKTDFLKMFICMWGIGFGLDISMQFSSTKDKSVGKLEDLLKRSKAILSSKIQPPDHPPLRKLRKGSSPADFGLTPLAMYEEGREKYTNMITDQVLKVLELDKHYGIKLLYDWNSIQRQYWDVPLSDLQKEFTVGRIFREDGQLFKVVGLSWDSSKNEYALYYHEHNPSELPPTRINDPENRVLFSFFTSIPLVLDGVDKWIVEWQN